MAGYLGASPVPQTIQKKQSFTATASQTTFTTTGYTDGAFINVYLNGVRLINGTDYQATNGSDIVLTSAASASDVLDFETFNEFTLVDQTLETPTFRTSATLKNDTEEDTDGGRESTLIFKGEQSGGEISTLAEIEASHDGTADDEKGDLIFRTNDGSDGASPTEAARIDSGQNLLVGKTSVSLGAVGIEVKPFGEVRATADGAQALQLNRLTSDGTIADFRKDGTTVGSIGTLSGDLYIGDNATGLLFDVTSDDAVKPFNTSTPAERDDGISLGSSAARFKNLYLSGGAYIGGTTGSNYLEDYEEGTWTPVFDTTFLEGAFNSATGFATDGEYYTKIGNNVQCWATITSITGSSGNLVGDDNFSFTVASLPFAPNETGTTTFSTAAGHATFYEAVGSAIIASGPLVFLRGQSVVVVQVTATSNTTASSADIQLHMSYQV